MFLHAFSFVRLLNFVVKFDYELVFCQLPELLVQPFHLLQL